MSLRDSDSASFRELVRATRNGDESAAERIVNEFTGPLVAMARRQIGERLSARVEAEDVVQSMYRSLFVRMRDGEYELGSGSDLWKLVVTMTLNKIRRKAKFHTTQKRGMQREQRLTSVDGSQIEQVGDDAAPDDIVELLDTLQTFVAGVSPRERPILELRLQGLATDEIAKETGRAERSVRRILQNLRIDMERMVME